MPLPPLYKFMDVRGAKLTFGNRTFRHAKPSTFNDVEDMTVQSLFPEDCEVAWERIAASFADVVLRHINSEPTCGQPLADRIRQIQAAYRARPDLLEQFRRAARDAHDIADMRQSSEEFLSGVNEFMQEHRVLCVTTEITSERLWREYADNYSGIALRIEPNVEKDSKFQLFEPVSYAERRPPFYADTLRFAADSLFGDLNARIKEIIHRIIYTKTLRWQHESEYRLAIVLGEDEEPYDTLSFHPEEITELYLGEKMKVADLGKLVGMARRLNPRMVIFLSERDRDEVLQFRRLHWRVRP